MMEESKTLAANNSSAVAAAMGDRSRYVTLHDEFRSLLDAGASDDEEDDDEAEKLAPIKAGNKEAGEEGTKAGNGADY